MLACRETVLDSRKILALTVYRHSLTDGSDNEQRVQLASVTQQSPKENRVRDAKHIDGELSDTKAHVSVRLLKSSDCVSVEFSCVAMLVDNNGRKTMMKSAIGIGGDPNENPEPLPKLDVVRNMFHAAYDMSGTVKKVENFMAVLMEKLQCIETRLGDSITRDNKLEDKLENLQEKIYTQEIAVSQRIELSSNRMEDKMDRMKDKLEDRLSEVSAEKHVGKIESECSIDVCRNISSQLALVEVSVESMDKNLNALGDQVRDIRTSLPKATIFDKELGQIATGVDNISTVTDNLITSVDALKGSCAHKVPAAVEEFFDALGTGVKEWRLAFRGKAYNNVEVYPAYLYGTGIPAEVEAGCKQFNHSLPCANHYRNRDALENWAKVKEVLVALYVKGQMVKRIIFNGKGSTFVNWFEGKRVLESSWGDLKTLTHNLFSIEGDVRSQLLRRFIVNHLYKGCPEDKGWFMANDAIPGACPWEKKLARPEFLYAKGNTVTLWQSSNVARADVIGIFIKYQ